MQIIPCDPFDDDAPKLYGRYLCSSVNGNREHVHGDASLVEMCASYSCTSSAANFYFSWSKKTISLNILIKYSTLFYGIKPDFLKICLPENLFIHKIIHSVVQN